jgi:PASTA domain
MRVWSVLARMADARRVARLGALAAALLLVASVSTGAARADLSWSQAFRLNGGTAVACPISTQCTAVGLNGAMSGDEVTFNPQAPGSRSEITVDSGNDLFDIVCPSATQCTALDASDQEVTFNPQAPGSPTPVTIDDAPTGSGSGLRMVSCPSTTQCTATDSQYQEVTFNPQGPGSPTPVLMENANGANGLNAIDCPSTSQCTAADDGGRVLTFDPASPGGVKITKVAPNSGGGLTSIACPSTSQCTAGGVSNNGPGFETTFNPTAVGQPAVLSITGMVNPPGIACPSSTQCTAEDQTEESTFNPQAPGHLTATTFDNSNGASGGHWIACPLTSECVTIDVDGRVDVGVPSHGGGTGGGAPRCLVPKVKGKTLAAARRAIVKDHCAVGKVSLARSAHVKKGHVISQSPSGGHTLRSESKVNLVVSKGSSLKHRRG